MAKRKISRNHIYKGFALCPLRTGVPLKDFKQICALITPETKKPFRKLMTYIVLARTK